MSCERIFRYFVHNGRRYGGHGCCCLQGKHSLSLRLVPWLGSWCSLGLFHSRHFLSRLNQQLRNLYRARASMSIESVEYRNSKWGSGIQVAGLSVYVFDWVRFSFTVFFGRLTWVLEYWNGMSSVIQGVNLVWPLLAYMYTPINIYIYLYAGMFVERGV